MALSFPNSPTDGQIYTDSASGNRWSWDAANTSWKSTGTFTQTITVASTAPGSPVVGQLWWNQDYGRLLVYYNDGTSSQWVDASPSDATSALAFGQANTVFGVANSGYGVANAAFGKANNALANTSGISTAGDLYISSKLGVGTASVPSNQLLRIYGGRSGLIANNETYSLGLSYSTAAGNDYYYIGATSGASPSMVFSNAGGSERMRIDTNGYVTMPYQPAFVVGGSGNSVPFNNATPPSNAWSTIVQSINRGSCFNTTNSTFTAPASGIYIFGGNLRADTTNQAYIYITPYINGSSYYGSYGLLVGLSTSIYASAGFTAYAFNFLLKLNTNDTVQLNYNGNVTANYAINTQSYFYGYLLG